MSAPMARIVFPAVLPLELTGREAKGRPIKRVTEDFDVKLRLWDEREIVLATVEKGFESDGVSGPPLLKWWLPPWGKQRQEAVFHDWMLELARRGLVSAPKIAVDLMFLIALATNGSGLFRSLAMFLGVQTRGFQPA